jgi:hypothetical protein
MIYNFSNIKLNENTTTAKGLEAALDKINKFIVSANGSANNIIYGKFTLDEKEGNLIQKLIDQGLLNALDKFVSIDFCNLLNYAINQIPGGKPFNPNDPIPDTFTAKKKYQIQKAAFTVQKLIDQYKYSYGDAVNAASNLGLSFLLRQISDVFNTLIPELKNPETQLSFVKLGLYADLLENISSYFSRFQESVPTSINEVEKILRTVDKVRTICSALQAINSPAQIISIADNLLGGDIQEKLADLNKILKPTQLIPTLRQLIKSANNVISIAQKVVGYINTSRLIIKLCVLFIKVFTLIKAFFAVAPIPNISTTTGLTTVISNKYEELLTRKGTEKFLKRLEQIGTIINLIAILCTTLIVGMQEIVKRLNLLLLNLESCDAIDDEIKNDIKTTITNLNNSINQLEEFLTQYNSAEETKQKQFGEYTIEIISEQLVDENISIKRRFGIARNSQGFIVVSSTPTFASLDQIIINEVKLLLVSGGFVNIGISSLAAEDIALISDSLKYLETDDISISDIESDISNLQDDKELDLGTFVGNLPGGKALKKRTRKLLIKNNEKLIKDLKNTDPNSTYSQNIIKQKESETTKLKIQDLEAEKNKLKAVLLIPNPLGYAVVLSRIAAIDKEINRLKNTLK